MTGNWLFVGAAFAVTWAVLAGYLFHLHRALHRARMHRAETLGEAAR